MIRTFLRYTTLVAAACAVFSFSVVASSPVAAQTHEVGHWLGLWGLNAAQHLRICISSVSPRAPRSESRNEQVASYISAIADESGNVVLERVLSVPPGEFRCTDILYDELVAAGLDPGPASAPNTQPANIKFSMNIHSRGGFDRPISPGASQTITIGAAQNIDVGTGKIELHQPIVIGRVFNPIR